MKLAVIAHAGKSIGDGLPGLRRRLRERGIDDPVWREVPKSRKAPKQLRAMLDEEQPDRVIVWGGDGMVQRCIDVLAGTTTTMGIIPAGTANLLAGNLGIPTDLDESLAIALDGRPRVLDAGTLNGEHFATMAGIGFDALLIRDADALKKRIGRAAYVVSGARNLRADTFKAKIDVDGARWFSGRASCVLIGNVGEMFAGLRAFDDAEPDDGLLELGVVTADGAAQWVRTMARVATHSTAASPFVRTTKARSIEVRLDRRVLYELDGGDRSEEKTFTAAAEPGALRICTPGGMA